MGWSENDERNELEVQRRIDAAVASERTRCSSIVATAHDTSLKLFKKTGLIWHEAQMLQARIFHDAISDPDR